MLDKDKICFQTNFQIITHLLDRNKICFQIVPLMDQIVFWKNIGTHAFYQPFFLGPNHFIKSNKTVSTQKKKKKSYKSIKPMGWQVRVTCPTNTFSIFLFIFDQLDLNICLYLLYRSLIQSTTTYVRNETSLWLAFPCRKILRTVTQFWDTLSASQGKNVRLYRFDILLFGFH